MIAQVDPFCKGLYFACPIPLEPAISFGHVYEEHSKVRFAGTVAYLLKKTYNVLYLALSHERHLAQLYLGKTTFPRKDAKMFGSESNYI